jgi:hypothetical protein
MISHPASDVKYIVKNFPRGVTPRDKNNHTQHAPVTPRTKPNPTILVLPGWRYDLTPYLPACLPYLPDRRSSCLPCYAISVSDLSHPMFVLYPLWNPRVAVPVPDRWPQTPGERGRRARTVTPFTTGNPLATRWQPAGERSRDGAPLANGREMDHVIYTRRELYPCGAL